MSARHAAEKVPFRQIKAPFLKTGLTVQRSLFHERKRADYSRFLGFSAADLEESDDLQDCYDKEADRSGYPAEERHDHKECAEYLGDLELHGLSYMELEVSRVAAREECDHNADNAQHICCHSIDLVIRDILGVKLGSMIVRIVLRSSLLILILLLLLLLLILLLGLRLRSRSGCRLGSSC